MIDFTFAEIDELIKKGYLDKKSENQFRINFISKSINQGFGSYHFYKDDNGEIVYKSSQPTNVDPDDGSYDMKHIERKYKTFDDFLNRKPYFTKENLEN